MAEVVIALGSNLGDRKSHLSNARKFLSDLSAGPLIASSIYETEPVGEISTHKYYNAVCCIRTQYDPIELLKELKHYEHQYGRDPAAPRWANRTIDLDIIDYDRKIINNDRLHVPHPEYEKRLFVLQPLAEILPDWSDIKSGRSIQTLITDAPKIEVFKTRVIW